MSAKNSALIVKNIQLVRNDGSLAQAYEQALILRPGDMLYFDGSDDVVVGPKEGGDAL